MMVEFYLERSVIYIEKKQGGYKELIKKRIKVVANIEQESTNSKPYSKQ